MELLIKGRNVELSDFERQYIEKKIGKLDRYLPPITDARVDLSSTNTKTAGTLYTAQVTVRTNRAILRAEERSTDLLAVVDAVMDTMYRQIARYKGKRLNRWRGRAEGAALKEAVLDELEEPEEEEQPIIVRRKRFQVLPMDEREAIEQMELLGHDFFIFHNAETGEINVVYRRRDGNYGILEPELA